MKVAVCISGEFRHGEVARKQVQPFWDLFRKLGIEIDFYIHAWEDPGIEEQIKLWKPKAYQISPKIPSGQWPSTLYAFELSKQDKYTHKIRWRSDNAIWNYSKEDIWTLMSHPQEFVFSSDVWINHGIGEAQDQFVVGKSDLMDKAFTEENFARVDAIERPSWCHKNPWYMSRLFDHCKVHTMKGLCGWYQRLIRDNMVDEPWMQTNKVNKHVWLDQYQKLNSEFKQKKVDK